MGLGLIAAAVLIWLDRGVIAPKWSGPVLSPSFGRANDVARYHAETFRVVRVIDGDTLDLDAADGGSSTTTVRLLGIDAPEMVDSEPMPMSFGREATELARRLALGKQATVYLDERGDTRGPYGSLLAYLELPDGAFLNETLVSEGCAHADVHFPHSYYHKYRQLEAGARALDKGLWQAVTRQP